MTVDELEVLITANTSALRKEINKTNTTINSLKKNAEKSRAGVTSTFKKLASGIAAIGIGKIIKDSIQTGMDAIESDSLFDTSLGNMADSVREWSDEIANTLGLNAVAMRKNVGVIYNMTTSMGLAGDNALKMSKGISLLTEDMASFYNLDSTEAFNKLRAGLTGETEPLKALGILVDENTIKQVAYSEGIATVGSELTQQQKVLARYVAILKQTGNAQGDLARTINSPANQLRILKNQVSQLGLAFGNLLLPVVSAVLPYITAFAKVVTIALNSLAKFLGISTGSGGLGSMSSDISNISSGLGDVNTGLGDATKNAKKLKGSLAGFDEMNVLTDNSSDTGSSGSAGTGGGASVGGLDFDLGDYDAQLSGVTSEVDEIVEKIQKAFSNINFSNLINSFKNLGKSVTPILDKLKSGLQFLLNKVLKPLAKWTIEDALPAFLDVCAGAFDVLNATLDVFQPLAQWLWDNFLEPVASWTGGVIVEVLDNLAEGLESLSTWITDNQETILIGTGVVAGFFAAWKLTELMAFIAMSGGIVGALSAIQAATIGVVTAKLADKAETIALTAMYAKDFIVSIASGTAALVKNAAQWVATTAVKIAGTAATVASTVATTAATAATWLFNAALAVLTSPITLVIAAIAALVAGVYLLIKNWDKVKEAGAKAWEFIKNAWNVASTWFKDTIITPIGNFFTTMWSNLKTGASQAWEGIKSVFSVVTNWFKNVFTEAWQGVKNVFSTGGAIFVGITEGITSVFKTVVNGIISGINTVIAIPFNGINKALKKIRDISFLDIEPFKNVIKLIDVPQIPQLARGGIVDSPTYAMIGEAGTEAVMPLERNTGWIDKLAEKIGDKIGGNGSPIQLTVKLGEDTIFSKFIDYANAKSFETNGEVFSI